MWHSIRCLDCHHCIILPVVTIIVLSKGTVLKQLVLSDLEPRRKAYATLSSQRKHY